MTTPKPACRGALKIASTCQPHEAIADILALQENEQKKR